MSRFQITEVPITTKSLPAFKPKPYQQMWVDLKGWVKKEQEDMLTNPHRTELYYTGIACQTSYIQDKMEELEKES